MTSVIKWYRLPFNSTVGYPQKVSAVIIGYGFDITWSFNNTTEFSTRPGKYDIILKIVSQFDRTVCFNGKLCRGNIYDVIAPWLNRSWFYMKPFTLELPNPDVRVIPAEWVESGNFYQVKG